MCPEQEERKVKSLAEAEKQRKQALEEELRSGPADKPEFVKRLVFGSMSSSRANLPLPQRTKITYRVVNNVKNAENNSSVTIVENADDHKFIRMDIRNGSVSATMAANYFMVTAEDGWTTERIREQILTEEAVAAITEGRTDGTPFEPQLWLERCDTRTLAAIHIYPPHNIQLYDYVIKMAGDIGLKPFPDYINLT